VHGKGIGHTLGFPTANIEISDNRKVVPANGVYITSVVVDGKCFGAMLNIGFCPTFDGKTQSIELHILGYSDDLYGKTIEIRFCSRIRGEQKFDKVENLVAQLEKDRSAVEEFFRKKPLYL
jgi:riboflavin kinase/FMN adenylyltransferase